MVNVGWFEVVKKGKRGRKAWHLLGGAFLPVLAFFVPLGVLLSLVGVATAVFIVGENLRFAFPRVNGWVARNLSFILKKEEKSSRLTGSTWLLISTLLVFLAFEKPIAIAALLFLVVGDFSAAVIGERFGRTKAFGKSLEGSLTFLASCLLLSLLLTWGPAGLSPTVLVIGAVVATVCELMPLPLDDNFSVPLAGAGAMMLMQGII